MRTVEAVLVVLVCVLFFIGMPAGRQLISVSMTVCYASAYHEQHRPRGVLQLLVLGKSCDHKTSNKPEGFGNTILS